MSLEVLLVHPLTEILGWTLLHSLWQGALVLLALLLTLRVLRSATARYAGACFALALLLIAPAVTALWLAGAFPLSSPTSPSPAAPSPAGPAQPGQPAPAPPAEPGLTSAERPAPSAGPALSPEPFLPWLVVGWLFGLLFLSLRLLGGLLVARGLRTRGTRPAPRELQAVLRSLSRRLGLRAPVRLLVSVRVQVPMVVGWLRPVILLPVSALTGLSPQQLEAVLMHELAHIRRHDALVNLLQNLVETLLFYHPAVWWVSDCVRQEREDCCDDLVLAHLRGEALVYAQALLRLEEARQRPPRLVLAAGGGSLAARVRRLLGAPAAASRVPAPWVAGMVFAFSLSLLGSLALTPQLARAQADCHNPFFPVAEGARWEYARSDVGYEATRTVSLSEVAADGFTQTTEFVSPSGRNVSTTGWQCGAEGLARGSWEEMTASPLVASAELWGGEVTEMRREGVDLPEASAWYVGSAWSKSVTLELRVDEGNGEGDDADFREHRSSSAYEIVTRETVTVPAGTFDAFKVALSSETRTLTRQGDFRQTVTGFNWYSEGVGLVRQESSTTFASSGNGTADRLMTTSMVWELRDFEVEPGE